MLEQAPPQTGDYENTVATTWQISFAEVERASPAAADLMRLCAFVAPDAIPLELVLAAAKGEVDSIAAHFGDMDEEEAEINVAHYQSLLAPLLRYSLVTPNHTSQTFGIHRLVQAVMRWRMDEEERQQWLTRAANALNLAFPKPDFPIWTTCERLAGHVQTLAERATTDKLASENLAALYNNTAHYLHDRGRFSDAEPFFKDALEMRRRLLDEDHADIAQSLNNLGVHCSALGLRKEAEHLYEEALEIRRKALPEGHSDIAESLANLASLYKKQGRYSDAEPLYDEALGIRRKALPEGHPDIASSLNNLAGLYQAQGRYSDAEPLYNEALQIDRQALPEGHPGIATDLINLASLYKAQGRYSDAEPLYDEALGIRRKALPEGHPDIATSLNNLASLYQAQSRYSDAERLCAEALAIARSSLGENHPHTIVVKGNLAEFEKAKMKRERLKAALQARLNGGQSKTDIWSTGKKKRGR